MALQKELLKTENDFNVDAPSSYVKIEHVIINSALPYVNIDVRYFFDEDARINNKNGIKKETIRIPFEDYDLSEIADLTQENIIKSAYLNLKKQEKYCDLLDV